MLNYAPGMPLDIQCGFRLLTDPQNCKRLLCRDYQLQKQENLTF